MKEIHAEAVPVEVPLMPARPAARPGLPVALAFGKIADYVALTKPRLNLLVVATSAAGYYLGTQGHLDLLASAWAVMGTALVAGGAAVLNQVFERETDALMRRTRTRPLPDGRVAPRDATMFGLMLSGGGTALLALRANPAAALLALTTIVVYLMVYTPMKRRTALATFVGAVPGALPPLIGWTASRGAVSAGGLALFAIVFCWQIPHFMAIAWLYRDDYGNAGFPMLPVIEPDGRRTARHALIFAAALVVVSLAPTLLGVSGRAYFIIALALGLGLVGLAARFASTRGDAAARWLFFGSITYLPLIWTAMILDRL